MAQIDPSIILQSRRPKLPDAGEMMQLRDMTKQAEARDMQLEDAKRARNSRQTLADMYKSALQPDGSVDNNAIMSGMAAAGYGEQVPDLMKQGSDARKAALMQEGEQVKLAKQKMEIANQGLGALLTKPNVNHQDVIAFLSSLVDRGVFTQAQGAQMVQQLPGPDRLREFLVQKASENLDAAKQLDMILPKFSEQNRGATISEGTYDPMTGIRTERREIQRTVSPDAAATAAAMLANPAVTYRTDVGGNTFALPARAPAGAPIAAQPVVGPGGKPLTSPKPPGATITEGERKAATLLSRLEFSEKQLREAVAGDSSAASPSVASSVAGAVPMVGNAAANLLNPAARQRVEAAQLDILDAALTLATGAAYTREQLQGHSKSYFPQLGDEDDTVKDKAARLQNVIKAARIQAGRAGPGAAGASPPPGAAGGATPRVTSDADYNALPSGTTFIAPDGSQRVKP